jgi:hypothetical protein
MSKPQGFFQNHTPKTAVEAKKTEALYFDGRGDLAYTAVVINYFASPLKRCHDHLATSILKKLPERFQNKHPSEISTPSKHMHQLCLEFNHSLLEALSHSLTCIALDDILQHSDYYQTAFFHPTIPLTTSMLQNPCDFNPWLMLALSRALSSPFCVIETNHKKLLNRRLEQSHTTYPYLSLHKTQRGCFVTAHIEPHSWLSTLDAKAYQQMPFLSDESYKLYATNLRERRETLHQHALSQKYTTIRQRLNDMALQHVLSQDELMDFYETHILSPSDRKKNHVGIEHGTQQFFDIMNMNALHHANTEESHTFDAFTAELLDAVARAITLEKAPDITLRLMHMHQR